MLTITFSFPMSSYSRTSAPIFSSSPVASRDDAARLLLLRSKLSTKEEESIPDLVGIESFVNLLLPLTGLIGAFLGPSLAL